MSERKNGRFLYVHEQKQLFSFAVNKSANKTVQSKVFRCIQHTNGCLSRINNDETQCDLVPKWVAHNHSDDCAERFKRLKALEQIKIDISSVENVASGSRMKRPREVYIAAIVK